MRELSLDHHHHHHLLQFPLYTYTLPPPTHSLSHSHTHPFPPPQAYFSPITGSRIITTCQDNRLRVWDAVHTFGTGAPDREIVHSHDFNRHLTPFKAEFDPKDHRERLVVIGRCGVGVGGLCGVCVRGCGVCMCVVFVCMAGEDWWAWWSVTYVALGMDVSTHYHSPTNTTNPLLGTFPSHLMV